MGLAVIAFAGEIKENEKIIFFPLSSLTQRIKNLYLV